MAHVKGKAQDERMQAEGPNEARWDRAAGVFVLAYAILIGGALLLGLAVGIAAALAPAGAYVLDYPFGALDPTLAPIGVGPEMALLLVAICASGLGALTHSVKGMSLAVVDREFDWRWLPWNLTHPMRGAVVGVLVYGTLRAGLVVVDGAGPPGHPFAVLTLCGVGGLAADRTIDWLKQKFDGWMKVEPRARSGARSGGSRRVEVEAVDAPRASEAAPKAP